MKVLLASRLMLQETCQPLLKGLSSQQPSCFSRLQVTTPAWLCLQNSLELVTLSQKLRHSLTTVQFWLIQCPPHSLKSKTPTLEPSQKFLTFFWKKRIIKRKACFLVSRPCTETSYLWPCVTSEQMKRRITWNEDIRSLLSANAINTLSAG